MSYPLRWYHGMVREAQCWVLGHQWKSSWRHRADRDWRMAHYEELRYAERHGANPYCEWSTGWHYKCQRCRLRTRDDMWERWYRTLWNSLRGAARHVGWTLEFYILDAKRQPRKTYYILSPRYWPAVVLLLVVEFLGHALLPWWMDRDWPLRWLGGLLLDAEYRINHWLDTKLVCMLWAAPRAGEVGFWMDRRYHDPENPMRWTITNGETATASDSPTVEWTA